jgi:hypothetical protein
MNSKPSAHRTAIPFISAAILRPVNLALDSFSFTAFAATVGGMLAHPRRLPLLDSTCFSWIAAARD